MTAMVMSISLVAINLNGSKYLVPLPRTGLEITQSHTAYKTACGDNAGQTARSDRPGLRA